jgi:WD40 repeat protein
MGTSKQNTMKGITMRRLVLIELLAVVLPTSMLAAMSESDHRDTGTKIAIKLIEESRICIMHSSYVRDSVVLSSNNRRIAYVNTVGPWVTVGGMTMNTGKQQQYAVVDGNVGDEYDAVKGITFNSDSKKVAYAARKGGNWHVVIDSQEQGASYDNIESLVFSEDGKKLGFAAKMGNEWCAVLDGKESKYYKHVALVNISPNGQRWSFLAVIGTMCHAVIDGKEETGFGRGHLAVFSRDGKHVAYWGSEDSQSSTLVIDGEQIDKRYGKAHTDPVFSNDGNLMAFAVKKDDGCRVIVRDLVTGSDRELKTYRGIAFPTISPNGKRVAFSAQDESGQFLVVDGKEEQRFDKIVLPIAFSPDNKHFAYTASNNGKMVVVVDGVQKEVLYAVILNVGDAKVYFDGPDKFRYLALFGDSIYSIEEQIEEKTIAGEIR